MMAGMRVALCLLARIEDGVVVESQAHKADQLLELLDRLHFTEQLTLGREDGWECAEVWSGVAPTAEPAPGTCLVLPSAGHAMSWQRHGLTSTRYHAPAEVLDTKPWQADARELTEQEHECLRIWSGLPVVGVDSDERTLAMELPLDDHISLTKGCYTGQEVVARIHTYGHTNRSQCLLGIEGTGAVAPGTSLCELEEGDPVGRVMSVVDVPGNGDRLGLGFLPNAFTKPGTELRLGDGAGAQVEVVR